MNKEIEKAIEELKSLKGICLYAEAGQQPTLAAIELAKVYDLSITALEAQQADKWIPISSGRIPDEYTQVYVTTSTGGPFHLFYSNNEYRFGNYSGDPIIGTVIAWMPFYIPKPWKEEQL
jgi:guanyl-specific ribonuclease Sa